MKKILLALLVVPLLSWEGDQKISPYMQRSIDSLRKLPGSKFYSRGDTTVIIYPEDNKIRSVVIITTPIILSNHKKESFSKVKKSNQF